MRCANEEPRLPALNKALLPSTWRMMNGRIKRKLRLLAEWAKAEASEPAHQHHDTQTAKSLSRNRSQKTHADPCVFDDAKPARLGFFFRQAATLHRGLLKDCASLDSKEKKREANASDIKKRQPY